jgi:hypothetical protein
MALKGKDLPEMKLSVFNRLPLFDMNKMLHSNIIYKITKDVEVSDDGITYCRCYLFKTPEMNSYMILYKVILDETFVVI